VLTILLTNKEIFRTRSQVTLQATKNASA